jgi:hypothetical protein
LVITPPPEKLKEMEVRSQSEFKARELIFDIRRKELERNTAATGQTMHELGDLIGELLFISDDVKKDEFTSMMRLLRSTVLEMTLTAPPATMEGLQFIYQLCAPDEREFIKETLDMDIESLDPRDYEGLLMRYASIINTVEGIRVLILQDICVETFNEFLPESLKAGQRPKLAIVNTSNTQARSSNCNYFAGVSSSSTLLSISRAPKRE